MCIRDRYMGTLGNIGIQNWSYMNGSGHATNDDRLYRMLEELEEAVRQSQNTGSGLYDRTELNSRGGRNSSSSNKNTSIYVGDTDDEEELMHEIKSYESDEQMLSLVELEMTKFYAMKGSRDFCEDLYRKSLSKTFILMKMIRKILNDPLSITRNETRALSDKTKALYF
eukprot:TRINITY_DN8425_c0_g1_i2.p1 TRINITY_DN8425_c0_g1~~TRINITY_DN8425_c0_g1_i2.p1  ORF type:complete len:189 (-),score=38.65 TRINITY_DN8425_c0_g1_i2:105-611(-)